MFRNPFSFSGRIRRLEYGFSLLVVLGVVMFGSLLMFGLATLSVWFLVVSPFLIFGTMWFRIAQAVKRSHDTGYSGWCILIPFFGLYLLFADSQYGENRYGYNPKNIGNHKGEMDDIGSDSYSA
ncbi:DUF805 domain-containing protein [Flavobacterium sp. MAH-1]|uniref:DUF805 domain-containing protein n=1 Tax=Flavobacterium agri TaxID=2743471 RepID=A0A7Y9C6J0_9FLAO|nr:DUF805 domain-containing protein [Flavobacterium agri]NUY82427.1 DUF805 domain-containing protein [Flavobacterium agri]NYA72451.1 DUF805 domain-containing protein [Flavobacterium agri]